MRILYLVHQFYPMCYTGTEKFVLNIAKGAQKAGNTVRVVTYGFYPEEFYDQQFKDNILYKTFAYSGVEVTCFCLLREPVHLHGALSFPENPETEAFADMILDAYSPDLIHSGHIMRVGSFIKRARERNIPYIMTLTDFWMFCHKGIMVTDKGEICEGSDTCRNCAQCAGFTSGQKLERHSEAEEVMKSAAMVLSPSQFLADMYNKEFPGLGVQVRFHGMNFSHLIRKQKRYANDDTEPLVFAFMGTLSPHKGAHLVIEAMNALPDLDIRMLVYGSAAEINAAWLEELKQKADDRCEFRGTYNEKEVGQVLEGIDVVIIPSMWYENYPLVLHEAFASFIPVVGTALGGMAEKIKDGVNGCTFPVGDSAALADIMRNMAANREQINRFQDTLRRFMIPTVEQEVYGYWERYKEILQRRGNHYADTGME